MDILNQNWILDWPIKLNLIGRPVQYQKFKFWPFGLPLGEPVQDMTA